MKYAVTISQRFIEKIMKTLGVENNTTSHAEKYISAIGVFISMAGCYLITQHSLTAASTHLFVASMAASAVLLFAVPHGALSQPWPLIMGNILSAVIGVACYKLLGNTLISACIAVSSSVLLMYYLGCLHPPGGATAFFAVTSGADVHTLGFDFVWLVIAANIACLLVVAVVYNSFFHWRRYPAHLFQATNSQQANACNGLANTGISEEDITLALQQANSFIDVTSDDLMTIFESASQQAKNREALQAELNNKKPVKKVAFRRMYSRTG